MTMKKKYYEAEAEIVSFENEDIITSSLGNTYNFGEGYDDIEGGAPDSQDYGSGTNPLWNK